MRINLERKKIVDTEKYETCLKDVYVEILKLCKNEEKLEKSEIVDKIENVRLNDDDRRRMILWNEFFFLIVGQFVKNVAIGVKSVRGLDTCKQ